MCIYNSWHKYEQKLNDKHKVQFKRVSILEGDTASALHSLKSKVRKFKTFLIMRKAILKSKKLALLGLFVASFVLMSAKGTEESPMKFWGSTTSCGSSYSIEPGSCYQNCTTTYQVFWIVISETTDYAVPC